MTSLTYCIVETFEITNRGLVILGEATCAGITVGKECKISIVTPSGKTLTGRGYKEWLLRRTTKPLEKEAYLVEGISKSDVPVGSIATITQ